MEKEGEQRGYLDPKADRMAFTGSAWAFVAIVAAGAAAVFSGFWWFFLGIPVGIVLIFVARAVKRRSPEAAELHAQYAALERYLKDFGRLDEKPPDAVVLWEQFLIYAVVFGIADQVTNAMTVKVPEVVNDPAFRTPYILWWGMPGDGGRALRVQRDPPELQRRRSRSRRRPRRPAPAAAAASPAAAEAAAAAAASAPADAAAPSARPLAPTGFYAHRSVYLCSVVGRSAPKASSVPHGSGRLTGSVRGGSSWHVPIPAHVR